MSKKLTLRTIRQQLDAIDNQIQDLLSQRGTIIGNVRALKKGHIYHPGREADIIRNLFKQHNGIYPFYLTFRIWREIITTTLMHEGAFKVCCLDNNFETIAKLVHNHFSLNVPIERSHLINDVFQKLLNSDETIAALPDFSNSTYWWRHLLEPQYRNKLFIVSALPFLNTAATATNQGAFIICNNPGDNSKNDHGLYVLSGKEKAQIPAEFDNNTDIICRDHWSNDAFTTMTLIECNTKKWEKHLLHHYSQKFDITTIGQFAVPMAE